jgi:hypothetical protein
MSNNCDLTRKQEINRLANHPKRCVLSISEKTSNTSNNTLTPEISYLANHPKHYALTKETRSRQGLQLGKQNTISLSDTAKLRMRQINALANQPKSMKLAVGIESTKEYPKGAYRTADQPPLTVSPLITGVEELQIQDDPVDSTLPDC